MNSKPTSRSGNDDEYVESGEQPKPKRKFKKRWLIGLFLLLLFGPYLYFRVTSFSRKVVIVDTSPQKLAAYDPERPLSIVTWNIAHGRGATDDNWKEGRQAKEDRIDEIASLIEQLDCDIVVLNEVDFSATWSGGFDQAEAIAKAAGYPFWVKQSNLDFGLIYGRWHFGNVVISKYPISDVEVVALTPVNNWEDWVVGAKRGVACTIELNSELSISLVAVHMESRGEAVRVKQAYDLAARCNELEYPILLAGDLNTTPLSFPRSNVTKESKNAFEELVSPAATGLKYFPFEKPSKNQLTFPSDQPATLIDWVLYQGQEFEQVSQTVIPSLLSDHLPVTAEFRVRE